MKTFKNRTPSSTEQELSKYAGFYKIEENDELSRYVPIHMDIKYSFPKQIEVEEEQIEYETEIIFYHIPQTVKCIGMFDDRIIKLIKARMAELCWT